MKIWRLLLFGLISMMSSKAQEHVYEYSFFTNSRMGDDYFYSKTSSGNRGIKNLAKKIQVNAAVFHMTGNSLQLDYTNSHVGDWNATGVIRLHS
jgi:hypothetical protein